MSRERTSIDRDLLPLWCKPCGMERGTGRCEHTKPEPRVVAECWTCAKVSYFRCDEACDPADTMSHYGGKHSHKSYSPMPATDECYADGHNVRTVREA